MKKKEIEQRLKQIEGRLAVIVRTQTKVQGEPRGMEFSDAAAFKEHERLQEEKRELLALLTGK